MLLIKLKKKRRHILRSGIFLFLLIGMGCSSAPEPVVDTVPGWLESIPKDDNYYYAIGISGPIPRISDVWDQAIRRARAELGRSIISHISSDSSIISTSSGEYVQEIIEILSDTELNYTEVIERWFDRSGVYGFPEHCYVLVRIEKGKAEAILRRIK